MICNINPQTAQIQRVNAFSIFEKLIMVNHLQFIQVYLIAFCFIALFNQTVEAKHIIGEYRHILSQTEEHKTVYLFKSFSIIDLSIVELYINHESCNGDLGSLVFYNPVKEDMSNIDVSLDGGVNYMKPWIDNFGNVAVLDVEVGNYEIYIKKSDADQEERFLGNYAILDKDVVDIDGDGITACTDSNDLDPCIPVDCDVSTGIGCDLLIEKSTKPEYCHFENIFNPEESAYPLSMKVDDIEGYASYRWSTGDTSATTLVNPIEDTKYYVTVSDQSGCVLRDSIEVIVYFIPDIDINIQHIGCNEEPSVLTLFSPIGDDLDNVELSLDGGITYKTPTMDNFGNIIEFDMSQGSYSIYIRHKDYPQCEKNLDDIQIRHQSFFDEDEDGFNYCEDPDDDDACVPEVCENCDIVNKADFENETQGWDLSSDQTNLSEEQAISGRSSVQLIDQNAFITSDEYETDDYMSIKFSASIFSNSLEFGESLILTQSTDQGETFTQLAEWSSLTDFNNGSWFELIYNGPISEDVSSIIFRLEIDVNSSSDDAFIDNIEIQLCEIQYQENETLECNVINYDDVDSFRDFWKFGGPDALLSTEHPSSGQFSYHLQNGNGTSSSIISSSFSIPVEGELEVSFIYTAISMERTEFFALEISTNRGLTFVPYSSWNTGNFVNGEQYTESIKIKFDEAESDLRIRFTCYADSQYDHIYLDDIKIEFCANKKSQAEGNQINIEENKEKESNDFVENEVDQGNLISIDEPLLDISSTIDITIYPNPASEEIRFSMRQIDNDDQAVTVMLTQIDGTLVHQFRSNLGSLPPIDISNLTPGFYIVTVFDQHAFYLKEKLAKL